ncbi:probable RNA-dependent RNA polymerase 1 [Ixodes scapularis]|uniref:probable RNA-dependent RNA polymerase 1 n=1 Tax=Ixodes scapularis TaxID=6945 RepID=UPI001A9E29C8|nr:probable RNA-dependent RNA polymerase 1 [Ixodes scapularis]
MPHLGYSCCYALKAVLQQGNDAAAQMAMWPDNEREEFVHSILEFAHENEEALEQALFIIRDAIEKSNVVTLHAALPELFHQFRKVHSSDIVPAGSYLIRRLFVTPSRVFFLPPLLFRENRVLRRFNPEYAMRVTFRDDNLQQLSRSLMFHRRRDEMVDAIVGKFLREGVVVGNRRFKFLATSCSQLRDHGAWLYAEDSLGNTVDLIRTWMGDFSGIPNIAKKMARMGQCFSSTMETLKVPLKGDIVQMTPDIVGGRHPVSAKEFSFSDGIGMISASLMEKVCKKVGLSYVPCAIQIRYAGYKGMLCLNPCLQGDKLVLRPSMRKFDCSSSDNLELVKVSAPRLVCLNRPLITILEQLGVPSRVFLCLQQSTVLQCTDALVCETTALQVLSGFGGTSLPFAELVRGGFCLTRDPFVRSLLYAVYKNTMDGLRSKSRIAVPPNTGRNMLGVLDETQSLEYGEVFVQFTEHQLDDGSCEDDPKVPTTKILVGAVLVTKCPCLHPGDVRKFAAVDIPGLHHVKDCIVFPAKGPRPHPNEMAGSDLDGDEYIVIWEKDLLFPGNNQPAMVFCDHSSVVPSDDSLDGMVKFICNYIKNDNVGILSNAHLAWADKLPDGIFSKRCLNIAAKISTCIDFAKTGTTSHLTREEKPSVYPDFMEKAGSKDTYRSTRILGHLYRLHRYLDSVLSTNFQSRLAEDVNGVLFELPGWQCYQKTAEESLTLYSSQMERILCQYGIKSEGEVVAGLITTVSDYNRSTLDRNNVEVVVVKQYRALVESTRVNFFKEVDDACRVGGVSTEVGRKVILLQMASAWYKVTYADTWKERNCRSFPWAIVDVLLLVMKEKALECHSLRRVPRNLLVSKLDEELCEPSEKTAEDRALDVIFLWAAKEELIQTTRRMAPYICKRCLALLFRSFLAQEQRYSEHGSEQSSEQLAVDGAEMPHSIEGKPATVGGYVLAFLRHLSSAEVAFPSCDFCTWSSSQAHAVTLTALRTYSLLAIFGDLCYLGLTCDPDLHEPIQVVQEGNPVRIQVISPRFREMLNHSEDEVSSLLASWSGVQQVHIKKHFDRSGQINCILVLAVGRDWQRWFLEELLLQPWLAKAIEKRDLEPFFKD